MRLTHPHVTHPSELVADSRSIRLADGIARAFGSMRMFYGLVIWQVGWISLATLGVPLLRDDPYPFVFCLFLSNLIQLWALPVLGVATNRADVKRQAKADADHQALTALAVRIDEIAAAVLAPKPPAKRAASKPAA